MRIVLDTNVFLSGIFWSGPPHEILGAWRDRKVHLITSLEILEEYKRVAYELFRKYPTINVIPMLDFSAMESEIIHPTKFNKHVCRDPDDDMFLECALSGEADYLVTGDKDLLVLDKEFNFRIMKPRNFLQTFKMRS